MLNLLIQSDVTLFAVANQGPSIKEMLKYTSLPVGKVQHDVDNNSCHQRIMYWNTDNTGATDKHCQNIISANQ